MEHVAFAIQCCGTFFPVFASALRAAISIKTAHMDVRSGSDVSLSSDVRVFRTVSATFSTTNADICKKQAQFLRKISKKLHISENQWINEEMHTK